MSWSPADSSCSQRRNFNCVSMTGIARFACNWTRVGVGSFRQTTERCTRSSPSHTAQKMRLEFGLFDQQAIVAVEGKIVAQYPYVTAWDARKPTARPIGILGSGGSVAVEDLKVYRDLYYLDPDNLGIAWEAPRVDGVPAKQTGEAYLVLGDNSHASADSRHWSRPYIDRRQLRGKVLRLQW